MALFDQPWTLFAVVFIVLLLMVEIGARFGERASVGTDQLRHEQLVAGRDGVGLLLSLLLGFTLAMVLSRFDQRKQLIVDEANTIGTATLRAQLLSEPARSKVAALLRDYVDARIEFSRSALGSQDFDRSVARTKELQDTMWEQSVEVAHLAPNPITSIFIQSLNDVIDLSEKRMAMLENRVPPAIWVMLLLISLLTCFTTGMSVRRRFWFVMMLSPLMISIVIALIADLNSPRTGLIQIGRQSMERLQRDLQPEGNRH
jgi:hypothetical protein